MFSAQPHPISLQVTWHLYFLNVSICFCFSYQVASFLKTSPPPACPVGGFPVFTKSVNTHPTTIHCLNVFDIFHQPLFLLCSWGSCGFTLYSFTVILGTESNAYINVPSLTRNSLPVLLPHS